MSVDLPDKMAHSQPTSAQPDLRKARVAFVLPCLNEALTIEWCVKRACEAIRIIHDRHGFDGCVIVADNGSDDGSQELARAAGAQVVDVKQRGYGAALIGGFAAADAEFLVMGDSDCSYDFVEAVAMIDRLVDGAELCMGSRFKGEIKPGAMPWKNRYIGNPVLSGILRLLFSTKISDAHCGLRAIRKSTAEDLALTSTGMEFASEMVLKSVLRGIRIDEVPVTLSPDKRDRPPHLSPWRDGLRHLVYMLLLSPKYLFFVPAIALIISGLAVFAILMSNGLAQLVSGAGLRFGDHWSVAACAAVVVGVQLLVMGIFAMVYSYREGFRVAQGRARWLLQRSRLGHWVALGLVMIALGLGWAMSITAGWIASTFGALDEVRSLVAAATLIMTGAQIFSSGCLLSIYAGNRSSHGNIL